MTLFIDSTAKLINSVVNTLPATAFTTTEPFHESIFVLTFHNKNLASIRNEFDLYAWQERKLISYFLRYGNLSFARNSWHNFFLSYYMVLLIEQRNTA